MATSQIAETFQLGSAQSVKRENTSASGAEKSHDFENIFDKASKSYSSGSSSTESSSRDSQAGANRQGSSSSKVESKNEESNISRENESGKQECSSSSAQSESSANDLKSESATSSQETDVEVDSNKSEEVKGESVKMDVEAQTALIGNVQPEVVVKKEEQPVSEEQNVQAESGEAPVENASFEQVAKQIKSVVVSSNAKNEPSKPVLEEGLVLQAPQDEPTAEAEDSVPQAPITIAAETLDLMAKAAIDNLSAQKNINAVSNPNVQQNASVTGIENSALIEKMVPDNAKVVINASAITSNQKSAATPIQQSMMSVEGLAQEQTAQPLVQVATDALSVSAEVENQSSALVSDVKENGKNTLSQDVLDSLDAKITSVKTPAQSNTGSNMNSNDNSNSNSSHQGLLAQQNTQDQAVMLQLESSSITGAQAEVGAVDVTASAQVDLATSSQVNTSSVQSQNVHIAKEITHSDIMEQVNKQLDLKNAMSSQNGEATRVNIILRPENLGKIELELINTKDGLVAKLTAENAQVKETLDKHLDGLKESLGAQGVNVNTVSVKINESQKQDTMFSFDKQPGQEQNQNQQNAKQAQEGRANVSSSLDDIGDVEEDSAIASESSPDVAQSVQMASNVDYKI